MNNPISTSFTEFSEAIPNAVICLGCMRDPDDQIINFECLSANKPAKALFAETGADLAGKVFFELQTFNKDKELLHQLNSVVISGSPLYLELEHKRNSVTGWYKATAMKYRDGLVLTYDPIPKHQVTRNIPERNEHDQAPGPALKQRLQSADVQDLLMELPALICTLQGEDHIYETVNPFYQDVFGQRILKGCKFMEVFSEFRHRDLVELLDNVLKTGETYTDINVPLIPGTGENTDSGERLFRFTFKPIYNDQKEITGVLKLGFEITRQVLARKIIANQADDWKAILETIPQIAWTTTRDGSITYFNKRYYEYTGLTAQQIKNREWKSVIHPAMLDQYMQAMNHSLTTGDDFYIEALFRRNDQEDYRWHLSRAIAIRNAKGEITSWVGSSTDINDQKTLEEELRKLQVLEKAVTLKAEMQSTWLNNLVMKAPFLVCTLQGPDHVYELVNPSYQKLFGHRQLAGRKVTDALPAFNEMFLDILNKVYYDGETISRKEVKLLIAKDVNTPVYETIVDLTCLPLQDFNNNLNGILVFAYDVTDQVLARKILEKSAEDLGIILEAIPQIAWVSKPDGKMNYFNKKWYHYTGLSLEDTEEQAWKAVVHPDMYGGYIFNWLQAVRDGKNFNMEVLVKRASDERYRWHLSQATPVRNALGEIILWVGTSTDINDHKELRDELENLVLERTREVMHSNAELKLSNIKLEEFAFVASHDLKEPLRKIITNSDFLRVEFFDQLLDNGKQYISRIQNSAFRMQKLIEDLLSFSQLSYGKEEFMKVDLDKLMNRIVGEQVLEIKNHTPEVTIKKLPVIEGVPVLLEQLFNNLISNALKFVKPGNTAKIVISHKNTSGIYTGIANASPTDKYCNIYVRDNGIGFNSKYVDQIFIIFKRLNSLSKYQGTGIGLALCKKIVENHNGSITARSKVNNGSTFIITLPYLQKI